MIFDAGADSNCSLSAASSSSVNRRTDFEMTLTGEELSSSSTLTARPSFLGPACDQARCSWFARCARSRGALRLAGLGDVRTGLVVVDVEVGRLVGRGPVVHVLQLGADGRRATGATQPV